MANIQIKRRLTGLAGPPGTLRSGEVAYNNVDDVLYFGKGDNGSGVATSIASIAGFGAFVSLVNNQTIAGIKTFSSSPEVPTIAPGDNTLKVVNGAHLQAALGGLGAGDMLKSVYDPNDDGKVTSAVSADNVPVAGVTGLSTQLALYATLASPALTGTPTAPTQTPSTNSTALATTAFVATAIGNLINSAPGVLDTLQELATALGNDPNFATTVAASIALKLTASLNLSDLPNVATARSNLGLGSIATQAANNVTITGGSITGVTLDAGTF